jgi:nicotinamide phosphoribosyltransferase
MKASAIRIGNGPWNDVYKDPVDDKGKLSKKGRLALIKNGAGEFETVLEDWAGLFDNHLIEVFRDGKLLVDDTFEEIRARAKLDESEYV